MLLGMITMNIFLDMKKMRKKLLVITFLDVLAISVLDNL